MSDDSRSLLQKYVDGPLQLGGALVHGLGVQALSGIKGLSVLPQGADAASKAIQDYQDKYNLKDLTPSAVGTVQDIAPVYYGAANSPAGDASRWLSRKYGEGSQELSDLVGRNLGPEAAGVMGSVADTAPMMIGGEGMLPAKAAVDAMKALPEAAAQVGHAFSVRPATEVGHPTQGLIGYHPDASVVDVHDTTGNHVGRMVMEPKDGVMTGRRADVDEGSQGQGLGTDMLRKGVDYAHDNGMNWESSAKVSPQQRRVYMKLQEQGYPLSFNPSSTITDDGYLTAGDGNAVFGIDKPTPVDDATLAGDGHPEGFAEGGEVLTGLAKIMHDYAPLKGLPASATVKGYGTFPVGPNPAVRAAAADYAQASGIPSRTPSAYGTVDPNRGAAIAQAFEAMPHNPQDPATRASYDAMIKETLAQYQAMKRAGVNVEFMPKGHDPYAASPRLMAEDVAANNHMYVYPTAEGFGAGDIADNPLLGDSGESFGGVPATHNDIFRAVHDYFGHAKEGVGFRANGEENAWRQHAGMYSDAARPAMTTETRGQNSYVNFGPNGPKNQLASGADTVYAPQKIGLLPEEFHTPDDPEVHFLHMSNLNQPDVTLDPKFYGTGIKGAEAKRGGTKTTSLYPFDIDPKDIETGLQSKTPYRVSVPASRMYDLSADPEGHLSQPDFSSTEDAIKDAGYAGYHLPQGQDLFRGQGRLFEPTPATRIGPGPAPEVEDDLAAGFADGGAVVTDLGRMMARYAPQAEHLASAAAEGPLTYNPTSNVIHNEGYLVPTQPERTAALDAPPTPGDIHDYLVTHQDAFDEDPSAVLHIHGDDDGHFMGVHHYTPDFGDAADKATTHFGDISTGEAHPAAPAGGSTSTLSTSEAPPEDDVSAYLAGPSRPSASWAHGTQTVADPQRNAFPGIYQDPRTSIEQASQQVGPEDPLLQRLFGVSRADLSDLALSRQGNLEGKLPGATANPRGSDAAQNVMTPQNEQRLIDILSEAKNSPDLYRGMTGWYSMDPLFQRFKDIFGEDLAPAKYAQFNALSGMASPGSDVGTEIARGSTANWLHNEGRFNDFVRYGGGVEDAASGSRPADMSELPGHIYHRTAQAIPMQQYLDTGSLQMKSPKVPMYIEASGVPETGFQTQTPVGDAHWSRGVGLADTRGARTSKGQEIIPGSSVSTPEMQTLAPWWRNRIASEVGLESVPAQALLWGSLAPITGVKSAIGASKLEILSTQIGKLADRLGISPESARDLMIQGKAGAFAEGGSVE